MPTSTITVIAFDRGVYNYEGEGRSDPEPYFLRWDDELDPKDQNRAFYAFDLDDVVLGEDDTISAIRLCLFLPDRGYRSPNPKERIVVHEIPEQFWERTLHGGQQGRDLFAALEHDPPIGATLVSRADEERYISVELSSAFEARVSLLLHGSNRRVLLSGRLEPYGPRPADRRVFTHVGSTSDDEFVKLEIDIDEF